MADYFENKLADFRGKLKMKSYTLRPSTLETVRSVRAVKRPRSSATCASSESTRSSNQAGSGVSSQVVIRWRRWSSRVLSTPFRLSPNVSALMNNTSCGVASNHSHTIRDGLSLTSSDRAQVSIRSLREQRSAGWTCLCRIPARYPKGEALRNWTSEGLRPLSQSNSCFDRTTAHGRPLTVITWEPHSEVARNSAPKRAFAS